MATKRSGTLILAAMIFSVAMMFIDQTIVAIAVPELQKDLSLSATGVQWIINGYLLSLSALFAFGGRLADIAGHRRMVVIGVVVFAFASAMCGATPTGEYGEAWIIFFRIVQGAGAALMFPAALAIVIASFPLEQRGRALAVFFGITGGLSAIGPLAGGYLTEITWRAIFWINIPVAVISLVLIAISKPENETRPAPIDYRGTVLIAAGMGLTVLGLQQASVWGWGSATTWGCIVAGLILLAVFVRFELGLENPLIKVRIFEDRAFAIDNAVLFLMMISFVPLFFFASTYAQISLGENASSAGLYLLTVFGGFAGAAQIGGRMLDQGGAKRPVVIGCVLAAVGFFLWGRELPDLSFDSQWPYILLTGAGLGLVLGPVSTDAVSRAPSTSYGEATGITQTVRNLGSSVGLAILGTVLILQNKSNIESSLGGLGISREKADQVADAISHGGGGDRASFAEQGGRRAKEFFEAIQLDYAMATRTVFYAMAAVLAIAFVVALIGMPGGKLEEVPDPADPDPARSG